MNLEIANLFPRAKRQGKYLVCGDIFGSDGKSFKYNLENDTWADFSSGVAGRGINQLLIARGELPDYKVKNLIKPIIEEKKYILSAPLESPEKQFRICPIVGYKYTKHWEYKDVTGKIAFYIVRYDGPDGKQVIPYSYNGTNWIAGAWPNLRPIYNLHKISNFRKILLVEGEKCADIASSIRGDILGITWSGGSNAVEKTDWSPLTNKEVILWPDNDSAGIKAMEKADIIIKKNNKTKILKVDYLDVDSGYDLCDFCSDGGSPLDFINKGK